MKKIIKLTESDLTRIVKRVIKESAPERNVVDSKTGKMVGTDKYVQVEKIKAQIEVLKMTHLRLSIEGIYNADNTIVFTINELEQQLKQLEDGDI